MLELLEFICTGPRWGWKALFFILLLSIIVDGVVSIVKCFTSRPKWYVEQTNPEEVRNAIKDDDKS